MKAIRSLFILFISAMCPILGMSQKADSSPRKSDTAKIVEQNSPKPFHEIITRGVISQAGFITVHKLGDHYYFEIPDSLLNRDILVVNRISKAAAGNRPERGLLGYSGDKIGENIITICKGPANKLFVKRMNYGEVASDSSANGMYHSLLNSNLQPIVAAFPIKALSIDSASSVIDVTDYLSTENEVIGFEPYLKKKFSLGGLQGDKSYLEGIKAFSHNMEISMIRTYKDGTGENTFTYEINSSFVLLPKKLMRPRCFDPRVGYFFTSVDDYDTPQGVETKQFIIRWRLEPKVNERARYLNGELVEPLHPIVFYIDPSTPEKWVPYLIKGVNDWQKAFEKAGFKNAIYALRTPKDSATWNLEDAEHNVIVYKPSNLQNANGPNVHDPRTGEIIETHINWYHNVTKLLHDWYFIQASPSDPEARKSQFDDSLMGKLIEIVCCHEVGHTLGLSHNFGASFTVPVEKLRDKAWVEKHGFCPSIMDYARFNYVAQPEDSISENGLLPRLGEYDKWAIEFGYRWFPDFENPTDEKTFFSKWVSATINNDESLWFGAEYQQTDPRCQSEDLGNDAMKAGYYGILNLKRLHKNLIEWTYKPNSDYENLEKMQQGVVTQYDRYLFHVCRNIGGVMWTPKTDDQTGSVVKFVSRGVQQSAVRFLQDELFRTPNWILFNNTFPLIGGGGMYTLMDCQQKVLKYILSQSNLTRLFWFQTNVADSAYTYNQLLTDLETGIWKELNTRAPINIFRRNLQNIYSQQLITVLNYKSSNFPTDDIIGSININTDAPAITRKHIKKLISLLSNSLLSYKEGNTKAHVEEILEKFKIAISPIAEKTDLRNSTNSNFTDTESVIPYLKINKDENENPTLGFEPRRYF